MVPVPSGAIYDEAGAPTREAISDEYLAVDGAPIEYYDGGVYEGDYNGKTYGLLTASEWNDLDNWKACSTNVANTQAFIKEQEANGGGDYPEAVHSALEATWQNFSWNESARSRIAFLILDAPPHHQDSIIESLKSSITFYAKNGIKLIPVAASGVDKDTESLLRFFDIVTGGTYVFLTDDCGIGYPHTEASVGDHEVEKIADLMLRLIKKYVE